METINLQEKLASLSHDEQPGFHRQNDAKQKAYSYYWVNQDGQLGFLSKTYQSAKSRNHTQSQLEKGHYQIQFTEEDNQFSYQVVNGNNKPMAIGPNFATVVARDKAVSLLPATISQTTIDAGPTTKDSSLRQSFRLQFYRQNIDQPWQGRITHSLSDKKQSFQGLDLGAIGDFIHIALDQSPQATSNTPATSSTEQPLNILYKGRSTTGGALPRGEQLDIQIPLSSIPLQEAFEARIMAKSLVNGQQILIGRTRGTKTEEKYISLPVFTNNLGTGLFRLNAEVVSTEEKNPSFLVEASTLVHLV